MLLFVFLRGGFLFASTQRTRKEFLSHQSLLWLRGRTTGALRAERYTSTSAEWTSCSACHELLCSRAFLSIVLQSVQNPQTPHFLQIFGGIWPMPPLPSDSFRTCFVCATPAGGLLRKSTINGCVAAVSVPKCGGYCATNPISRKETSATSSHGRSKPDSVF